MRMIVEADGEWYKITFDAGKFTAKEKISRAAAFDMPIERLFNAGARRIAELFRKSLVL